MAKLICVSTSESMLRRFSYGELKAFVNAENNPVDQNVEVALISTKVYSYMKLNDFYEFCDNEGQGRFVQVVKDPVDFKRVLEDIAQEGTNLDSVVIISCKADYGAYEDKGEPISIPGRFADKIKWTAAYSDFPTPSFINVNESVSESMLSIFEGAEEKPATMLSIFESADAEKLASLQSTLAKGEYEIAQLKMQIAQKEKTLAQIKQQIATLGGNANVQAAQQAQPQEPQQAQPQQGEDNTKNTSESLTEGVSEAKFSFSRSLFEAVKDGKTDVLFNIVSTCYDQLPTLSLHPDEKIRMTFTRKLLERINKDADDWVDGMNHWKELSDDIRETIEECADISMSSREKELFVNQIGVLMKDSTVFGYIFGKEFSRRYQRPQL